MSAADAAQPEPPPNPFAADVGERLPPPAVLTLFGATGDLAARKLLPAIYNLAAAGRLPDDFTLLAVADDADPDGFRAHAREAIQRHSRTAFDEQAFARLARAIDVLGGDFADDGLYRRIAQRLDGCGAARRLFYLATAPTFFAPIAEGLGKVGLGSGADPPTELLVEKPFGHDLDSARQLGARIHAAFDERQVLRIDHYLGKETVQNLLVLRFANAIFEPVWNCHYVDHVQITVAEAGGIGARAGYYDRAGALRDIIANHMLQLVCLVAMEPPVSFAADVVRDEKVKLLRSIKPLDAATVARDVVRGQYAAGWVGDERAMAYRDEGGVPEGSATETYVAARLEVDNWRWAGTPFYVRTGKRLRARSTEIALTFRPVPHVPFAGARIAADALIISVQPDEGASLRMMAKVPGSGMIVRPVQMDFQYGSAFLRESPEAYERLLSDALLADATLFTRGDEAEAQWRVVQPIIDAWSAGGCPPPAPYDAGSDGPSAADELPARDGRRWRALR